MNVTDRIIHLSHNDLDGYGAQFMISRAFYNVCWLNCDYNEINWAISQALKQIKMEILSGKPPVYFLITDINLTLETATQLQKSINQLPHPPKLILLDHHATGKDCADKFDWYHLDTRCCATCLTYQWLKPHLPAKLNQRLNAIADLINVTDLWLENDSRFNVANFIADLIFDKELMIREMVDKRRNAHFHMIENIFDLHQQGNSLVQIERKLYDIRLSYLLEAGLSQSQVEDETIPLEKKYQYLVLNHICQSPLPTVDIDGYKTAIFFRWMGTMFQHVSSMYLYKNPHIDIAMRIGSNARLSIRCRNPEIDVSQIARKYFNGGGHPQAAGGILNAKDIKNPNAAITLINRAIGKAAPKKS